MVSQFRISRALAFRRGKFPVKLVEVKGPTGKVLVVVAKIFETFGLHSRLIVSHKAENTRMERNVGR